jgi:hypothetical protein
MAAGSACLRRGVSVAFQGVAEGSADIKQLLLRPAALQYRTQFDGRSRHQTNNGDHDNQA